MKFVPTIGLEIHAELKTKTKMFCDSPNDPEEKHPNVNVCPVCMGHPGVLPVINKQAVKSVLRVGLAVGGKVADYSQFDRKNYFYPDLPKGYQISQYAHPLVEGGKLNGVRIRRVHLEEDAGKLIHEKNATFVDFNRAGVPLMELVTEPDISSAEEARTFAEELRLLLRYLGVSDADMEKGQMRIEANISVGPEGSDKLGTKVEVKNLNSFKSVEAVIKYEIERQTEVLEDGKKVIQETRGWNDAKQKTFSQRIKEEAHDYRYFPEPDLPPLRISEIEEFGNLQATISELPWQTRARLKEEYGLKDAVVGILVNEQKIADFFEAAISEIEADLGKEAAKNAIEITVNYLTSDLAGLMNEKFLTFEDLQVTPENFADLMVMIMGQAISSRAAKDVLRIMVETGAEPHAVVNEKGLEQVSDGDFIEVA
ncbi:MAG: Asp-tRNA(Asn)/Glu-tRNA(Gln) amidotransferase subunit GatB, partial [bacterium]|nr:Asp-tRNA(Asn)/Glu-tRNA(Gln) amidotransferase subunit GatB [bacterium]